MNFGGALNQLRIGKRVTRKLWEVPTRVEAGRVTEVSFSYYIMLVTEDGYDILSAKLINELVASGSGLKRRPWIGLAATDGSLVPWTPTHNDLLEEDWVMIK